MRSMRMACMAAALVLAACVPTPAPEATEPVLASTEVLQEPAPSSTEEGADSAHVDFALTSPVFMEGGAIPDRYTYNLPGQCSGDNFSPLLAWTGVPDGTESIAVLVVDPDGGDWVHWLQFNIPAAAAGLDEAIGGPDVGVKGMNDFGEPGYGGPCPPSGTHRYVFTLYALDTLLPLPINSNRADFESAIQGHVLDEAQLTGSRSRDQ